MWALLATPAGAAGVARGIGPDVPLDELHIVQWTRREGLPSDTLVGVQQTRAGFVWVAGFGGLARFDGIVFDGFNRNTTAELEANSFYDILEHEGAVLLATLGSGLWKLENHRFAPATGGHRHSSIRTLHRDRSGVVWAGLSDGGAARLEGDRLAPAGPPGLAGLSVRDIFETEDGWLWFATEGGGLLRQRGERHEAFTTASGLVDDSVISLAGAAGGGLWIGTQDGLARMRDGRLETLPETAGLEIFDLAEDDHGSLWIAAEQGLFRLTGAGRLERLVEHHGRSLRSISGVAFDHEGGVWVSSYTSGLFHLRESGFVNWTRASGLASERVSSVYSRRDGTLLIGGDLGSIQRLAEGVLSPFELRSPLPDVRVRGFFEDASGDLWVASYAGLLQVGPRGQVLWTVADGLPSNLVRFVQADSRGRLWAGTRGGGLVEILGGGRFRAIDTAAGLASDFVLALAEDDAGNLLVGTQSGLSVLAPDGGVRNLDADDGLPGDLVFNIRRDPAGGAWVATTGGLARYSAGRIDAVKADQGLPAGSIYDVAEDGLGHLWLTSSDGVLRVPKGQFEELFAGRRVRLEAKLFNEADGMGDQQSTGGARIARTADGRLWIPTLGGLSRLDPARLPVNPIAPPVRIQRVRVDGKLVTTGPGGGPVEFGPEARRFEFRFSALSFQAPPRVEVRYLLEGFDEYWVTAGTRRSALYTRLPPGDFRFRVIAANRDGVWNREGASFAFAVRRPVYQRPAFLALVALVFVAAPWTVYRWRLRLAERRSRHLENLLAEQRRLEAERARLVGELESRNEQLENLTYAVSHDLKSPLVTIHGFVGLLEKDIEAADRERVATDLARIREASAYMGRLLAQLNRVRRLERSEAHLETIDFAELAREVVATVLPAALRPGEEPDEDDRDDPPRPRVEVEPDMPPVVGDRLHLTELLQNLIDNAARSTAASERPTIQVGCRRDGAEPVFFVRDNGIGIEPRFQERVFGLFQRLDHRHEGTGVGLTIVKRVVEAHGGRIWIESAGRGAGAAFCFTLGGPGGGEPAGPR